MKSCPTVFIVDVDAGARRSVEALVASRGLATVAFPSAEHFLESFDPTQSGCVVADLQLQGMSGLDLQVALTERHAPIPVILVTAHANVPLTVRALTAGVVTVLEKPCFDNQLWDAIAKGLEVDARRRAEEAARRDVQARLAALTPHERDVLALVVDGVPNKTIAKRLDVSVRTVENRRQSIFRKFGVDSVAALVRRALVAEGQLKG